MTWIVYLFSFFNVPFDKMNLFLKYVLLPSSIVYQLISFVLIAVLVTLFQLKISGNVFGFFSSKKDKKCEYIINTFKDIGFKKGMILKRWPYYLIAALILGAGLKILSSRYFSYELFREPTFYFLSLRFGIYIFIDFLAKAMIFFTIFNYFLGTYKSIKLAYIFSSLVVFFTLLIITLITSQISIVDILKESFAIEPFMIVMYYWADNSIYYSWILMSTFQTLGLIYYAIQLNIFKV